MRLRRIDKRDAQERLGVSARAAALGFGLLFAVGCSQTAGVPKLDKPTPGVFLAGGTVQGTRTISRQLRPVPADGLALTENSEGFVPTLYDDSASYCSIAYGHLVKLRPCNGTEPPEFLQGVSREKGTDLLRTDMGKAQVAVLTLVEVQLSDGQYGALCDFVYNVGGSNFRDSTLLKVINEHQLDSVPTQLARWTKAGGVKQPGLETRRHRETVLFFQGLKMPAYRRTNESLLDIGTGKP